jgi:ketosteroid isomerase-like protein
VSERPTGRERAQTAFKIWNEEGLDAMAQRFWDPQIVWEEPPKFPDAGVRRGREECVRRMSERLALLGDIRLELVDATDVAENLILIEAIVRGRGTTSGAPGEMREFFLMETDEEGRTTRFREFLDRDAARAAVRAYRP